MRHMGTEVLRVRCSRETLRRFKRISADFRCYEDALVAMMDSWEGRHEDIAVRT